MVFIKEDDELGSVTRGINAEGRLEVCIDDEPQFETPIPQQQFFRR